MGLPFCVLFQLLITSCGQTSRNMHSPIFLSCCRLYLHENMRQGWQTWRHNQSLLSILRRIDLPDRDRDRCRKDRYGDCLQSGLVPQVPFTRWQSTLPSLGLAGMVASYVKGNLLLFKFYLDNIWKLHQLPQVITLILFHQTAAILFSPVDAEPGLAPGSGRGESCRWRWRFHPQTASNSCQVLSLSSRVGFLTISLHIRSYNGEFDRLKGELRQLHAGEKELISYRTTLLLLFRQLIYLISD